MQTIANLPHKGAYAQIMREIARHDRETPECVTRNPFDPWRHNATVREIRNEARVALHKRINERGGMDWRNWTTDREVETRRDAHDLHDIIRARLRVYQFRTRRVGARFGHLLATRED